MKYQYVVTFHCGGAERPSYKVVATGRVMAVRSALLIHKQRFGKWAEISFDTIKVAVIGEEHERDK